MINKFNSGKVEFRYMPKKVQQEIKMAPNPSIDFFSYNGHWVKAVTPHYYGDVAYRVRPGSRAPIVKEKVAHVRIIKKTYLWDWQIEDLSEGCAEAKSYFGTKKEAISSARKFCRDIGYKCKLVKE